jgi:tRNA dimethylallyltransferase
MSHICDAVPLNRRAFFIVGPTASGKSELAADVAQEIGAEIVSADAFQIYHGLNLLTAKPEAGTLQKVPHHLIGITPLHKEMNVEKFRHAATNAIDEIHSRGKFAIVVGGSGLYVKALTHDLAPLPESDAKLREELNAMSLDQLRAQLVALDPETARKIDMNNRRRVVRALEICLLTGKPASVQRNQWAAVAGGGDPGRPGSTIPATGVFVFRDRDELYRRINDRVEAMFQKSVIDEVRSVTAMSATALQMIGLRQIRDLLRDKMSILQCVGEIQQATRRYAKRQLTWFRHQSNFQPLNLSLFTHNEGVKWISQRGRRSFALRND